jgi:type IV secretory pathway VirJ component
MKVFHLIVIILLFTVKEIIPQSNEANQIFTQLPLKEFPASGASDYFVLLYTGDGGWKSLAVDLASFFQGKSIPVVGIVFRKYFWTKRDQSEICNSLTILIEHYLASWNKSKVVLIGYSFGAEVLPFAVSALTSDLTSDIEKIIMIAPGRKAEFEVTFGSMLDMSDNGLLISSEMSKINSNKFYIICDDNEDALCIGLDKQYDTEVLKGGHHFDGDFQELNDLIWNKLSHFPNP